MEYYRVDSRRITFREYWRISKLGFPIAAMLKILRIPLGLRAAIPYPTQIQPVGEEQWNLEGRRDRLLPDFTALQSNGILYQFLYREPVIDPDSNAIGAAFRSEDGLIYAGLLDTVNRTGGRTQRKKGLSLVTALSDGNFLVTSSFHYFESPPEIIGEWVTSGTESAIERHRERLAALVRVHPVEIPLLELPKFMADLSNRVARFQIARGLWRKLSTEEVAQLEENQPRRKRWLGFSLGINALALAFGFWLYSQIPSCSGNSVPTDEPRLAELDRTSMAMDCSEAESVSLDPHWRRPLVATLLAQFATIDAAENGAAQVRSTLPWVEDSPEVWVNRWGNSVLLRLTEGDFRRLKPLYDLWKTEAEEVALRHTESEITTWSLRLKWIDIEGGSKALRELEDYLFSGYPRELVPPWSTPWLKPGLEEDQREARRSLRLLIDRRNQIEQESFSFGGLIGLLKEIIVFDEKRIHERWLREHESNMNALRAYAQELVSENPHWDATVLNLYLDIQDRQGRYFLEGDFESEDPFSVDEDEEDPYRSTQTDAELLELLGALEYRVDETHGLRVVEDPGSSFTVQWGWNSGEAGEADISLQVEDPAILIPSVFRFLCNEGLRPVDLDLTPETDYY